MILVDAGPLVALVDASDQYHARCVEALKDLEEPMGTVWPAVTEALYRLLDVPAGQDAVLELLRRGTVGLVHLDRDDVSRMKDLIVVPLSRGGKSSKGNIVPACKTCNNKKKYLLPIEWDEYLQSLRGI